MTPEERRQFVRDHRTAVFGYSRRQDGPAMTVLYYVVEGDEILVSSCTTPTSSTARPGRTPDPDARGPV